MCLYGAVLSGDSQFCAQESLFVLFVLLSMPCIESEELDELALVLDL